MFTNDLIACAIFAVAMTFIALIPCVKLLVYGKSNFIHFISWLGADLLASVYIGLALSFYFDASAPMKSILMTILGSFIIIMGLSFGFAWIYSAFVSFIDSRKSIHNSPLTSYAHSKNSNLYYFDEYYGRVGTKNVLKSGLQKKGAFVHREAPVRRDFACVRKDTMRVIDNGMRIVDDEVRVIDDTAYVIDDLAYVRDDISIMPNHKEIEKYVKKMNRRHNKRHK